MKDKDELRDLLIRLQNSNHQAFSDLFKRYSQHLYFFCCKSLSKEDAEEITQNVFMTVWENRQNIDPSYSFSSYLFSIAKHQIYNAIRSKIVQKSFVEKYLQQTDEIEIPQEYDDTVEKMHEKLKQGIRNLPDKQREIFMMSRTYRISYKEIAEKLGISENTVDTSIRRSLQVLRRLIRL
ncbi:MAG: RNA polymerase sigma-70 factor [Bacteroidales bacterium]|nr:RNA polymerase sigma-70 factor [Bacteroidales bacterium]